MGKFVLLGVTERRKRLTAWREHQAEIQKHKEARRRKLLEQLESKNVIDITEYHYSQQDFESAMRKLTMGAMKVARHEMGSAASLEAFEPVTIPPHVFKVRLLLLRMLFSSSFEPFLRWNVKTQKLSLLIFFFNL